MLLVLRSRWMSQLVLQFKMGVTFNFWLFSGGYVCSIFTGVVAFIIWIGTFFAIFTNFGSQDPGRIVIWVTDLKVNDLQKIFSALWTIVVINFIYYALLCLASVQLFVGTKNVRPAIILILSTDIFYNSFRVNPEKCDCSSSLCLSVSSLRSFKLL